MPKFHVPPAVSRFATNYGMLGVLLVLCVFFSWATYREQHPAGEDAARVAAGELTESSRGEARVLIVGRDSAEDLRFADSLARQLADDRFKVVEKVNGSPRDIRRAIERLADAGTPIDLIVTPKSSQLVVTNIKKRQPALADAEIVVPEDYYWPTFLLMSNLLAVANRIVVIAVIAVGMTMVIITGGIDLSVGSLVALSAVLTAKLILAFGGVDATPAAMTLCCLGAIGICGSVGAFSGLMITVFRIPPFIATLAMMEVARGLALMITRAQSVPGLPPSFDWLGLDADLLSIPNSVLLMGIIYLAAEFVMSRTRLGRFIYAVGGNRRAARLSGIHVNRMLLIVYIVCGAMAGLGGVIEASQFTAGDPKSGLMYELYVIAAVVIGGTSLAGGEGRIFGTLIGAFIIAVIQNGMNLTNVESYTQKVVLGLVILGAVLLDMLRKQGFRGLRQTE